MDWTEAVDFANGLDDESAGIQMVAAMANRFGWTYGLRNREDVEFEASQDDVTLTDAMWDEIRYSNAWENMFGDCGTAERIASLIEDFRPAHVDPMSCEHEYNSDCPACVADMASDFHPGEAHKPVEPTGALPPDPTDCPKCSELWESA